MSVLRFGLASLMLFAGLGCELGPRSGRGLRLPPGDETRGALAFQELGCAGCHRIADESSADPDAKRMIALGGGVSRIESHGELVTSIVNPSHQTSGRPGRDETGQGEVPEMEDINDRMTVSQLIDLTEYLQSKYRIEHEPLYVR